MTEKTKITLGCTSCNRELSPDNFYKHPLRYANRLGREYLCKDCKTNNNIERRKQKKKDKIEAYWKFHNNPFNTDIYTDLCVPGFGDFTAYPIDDTLHAIGYLFLPVHRTVWDTYIQIFNKLYDKHNTPLTLDWVEFYLRQIKLLDDPKHVWVIYLQCKKCHDWKRTYFEEPLLVFSSRDFKVTPANYTRSYVTKTGWTDVCNDCKAT